MDAVMQEVAKQEKDCIQDQGVKSNDLWKGSKLGRVRAHIVHFSLAHMVEGQGVHVIALAKWP